MSCHSFGIISDHNSRFSSDVSKATQAISLRLNETSLSARKETSASFREEDMSSQGKRSVFADVDQLAVRSVCTKPRKQQLLLIPRTYHVRATPKKKRLHKLGSPGEAEPPREATVFLTVGGSRNNS